jgi:hypothetical protein
MSPVSSSDSFAHRSELAALRSQERANRSPQNADRLWRLGDKQQRRSLDVLYTLAGKEMSGAAKRTDHRPKGKCWVRERYRSNASFLEDVKRLSHQALTNRLIGVAKILLSAQSRSRDLRPFG